MAATINGVILCVHGGIGGGVESLEDARDALGRPQGPYWPPRPTALPARFAEQLAASRTLPRCTCAAARFVRRAYVINLDHRVHGERSTMRTLASLRHVEDPRGLCGADRPAF